MKKHKLLGWFVSVFPAILCLALLTPLPLRAQTCGQRINSDTVLTADIGPCTGTALFLEGHDYTLDLNGYNIFGSVVIVIPGRTNITIKGPGQIGFIDILPQRTHVIIHDLVIGGISIAQTSDIRIFRNEFSGDNNNGTIGIRVGEALNVFIYQNTISGYSDAGIEAFFTENSSIAENTIKGNGTGISVHDTSNLTIRGNRILHNQSDGIFWGLGTLFATVENNTLVKNGGNGVLIEGQQGGIIQNNIVQENALSGISVVLSGSVQTEVAGNFLQGNGTDLTWDGQGAANCWTQNVFDTSSPSPLPACQ